MNPQEMLLRANQLLARGEIGAAIEQFQLGIESYNKAAGSRFNIDVAFARTNLGHLLADVGLPDEAFIILQDATNDWHNYFGEERLYYFSSCALAKARGFLAQGKRAEVIREAIYALKLIIAWCCYRRTDLHSAANLPDPSPEDVDGLLKELVDSVTPDGGPTDIAASTCAHIAKTCCTIAAAGWRDGDLYTGLPWVDVPFQYIEQLPPTERKVVEMECISAYHFMVLCLMASNHGGSLWETEEEPPAAIRIALARWENLTENLSIDGLPQGFEVRLLKARDTSDNSEAKEIFTTLLDETALDGTSDRQAAVLLAMALRDMKPLGSLDQAKTKLEIALTALDQSDGNPFLSTRINLNLADVHIRMNNFDAARTSVYRGICDTQQLFGNVTIGDAVMLLFAGHIVLLSNVFHGLGQPSFAIALGKIAFETLLDLQHTTLDKTMPIARNLGDFLAIDGMHTKLSCWLIEEQRIGESLWFSALGEGRQENQIETSAIPLNPIERHWVSTLKNLLTTPIGDLDRSFAETSERFAESVTSQRVAVKTFDSEQLRLFYSTLPSTHDTTLLHYALKPDRLLITTCSATGVSVYEVDVPETEVTSSIAWWLRELRKPDGKFDFHLGKSPYDYLIAPIRDMLHRLGTHRIVIVGSGIIRHVPFGALHDGETFLLESFATAFWTSTNTARDQQMFAHEISLFGRTTASVRHSLPALSSVAAEFAAITSFRKYFDEAPDGSVYLDRHFNRAALDERLRAGTRILHLASHFDADPADRSRSKLLLGDDTMLPLDDLASMITASGGVDLLVVSACNSGLPSSSEEGQVHHSPAELFRASGVQSNITALWPVFSHSTAKLMGLFYWNLLEKKLDKDEALRKAQLQLLLSQREQPGSAEAAYRGIGGTLGKGASQGYTHPHHWAPFVLEGNWLRLT